MRAARWALAARRRPNFGLSLGQWRQGYYGCGLAAEELVVGLCGGLAGGCSSRDKNGRCLLLFLWHAHTLPGRSHSLADQHAPPLRSCQPSAPPPVAHAPTVLASCVTTCWIKLEIDEIEELAPGHEPNGHMAVEIIICRSGRAAF